MLHLLVFLIGTVCGFFIGALYSVVDQLIMKQPKFDRHIDAVTKCRNVLAKNKKNLEEFKNELKERE